MKAPDYIIIGHDYFDNGLVNLKEGDKIHLAFGKHRHRTTTYIVKSIGRTKEKEITSLTLERLIKVS